MNIFKFLNKSTKGKSISLIIFLVIVFILSVYLRLYNYPGRVALENDNSRDAQIAQIVASQGKIPLIGQFTSSGPFFYGPFWYWFLGFLARIPFGNLTLWYLITLISFVYLYLLYKVGLLLGNRFIAVVMVFFAGVNIYQVDNFLAVWNPIIIPLLSLLIIYFLIKAVNKNLLFYFFFLGFTLGLAITIHLQGLLLLPLLFIIIIFTKKKFLSFITTLTGFVLPFSTLIYFDLTHNFFNLRNFIHYLTVDQYNIYVPHRWLTYVFQYWPQTWGRIIGVPAPLALIIMFLLPVLFLISVKKLISQKAFLAIVTVFAASITILRYFRGERFVYLSLYAVPYVVFFTSWAVFQIFKKSRTLAILFFFLIAVFTIRDSLGKLETKAINYYKIEATKAALYQKFPGSSFAVYACGATEGSMIAHPMSYFLFRDGKQTETGLKIGFCHLDDSNYYHWNELTDKDFAGGGSKWWSDKSTTSVYRDTLEWWKSYNFAK